MSVTLSRQFSLDDQQAFAEFSGDFNPLHVDPVVARRTPYGAIMVHGLHLTLWALDQLAAHRGAASWRTVRAAFHQPVFLDDPVTLAEPRQESDGAWLAQVVGAEGTARASIWLEPNAALARLTAAQPARGDASATPEDPPFASLKGMRGATPLFLDAQRLEALFPQLAVTAEPAWIAVLLATTRVVGMLCPGLHSLFSGLELQRDESAEGASPALEYVVKRASTPRAPIKIAVSGAQLRGTLAAFHRPPPAAQPSAAEIFAAHGHNRYAGQHALILGGARGLGEICAKLIAAGGGEVMITYAHGADDAQRVADEIGQAGGRCGVMAWDVTAPPEPDVLANLTDVTHLYYFATPPIGGGAHGDVFDADRFAMFSQFYVVGFSNTVTLLRHVIGSDKPLTLFYPSTVFIEEQPEGVAEYAAAKAAGESLCAHLQARNPLLRAFAPRLPRLRTDQNLSLLGPAPAEPLETLAPWVERLHAPVV
ncbi:SDR family NAD(P)-dependent oxidoreductase [Magnetofaba australis]|uniref:Putative MaoC domain-containing protein dehydratase n=1 Tax=Magnetofaba australis IT-1 TaxID=1434232 RepID=A0A1Y2K7X5_9PROT|nr:SDR family NAD(P)-dependent oxidoreductase [Magnetofaba australis]OSM06782.1 putative MaoC domain-containing protein dehydratase [Magnetofaba australis IT-1]